MKRYAFADSRVGKVLFGIFMFALLMLSRNTLVSTSILGFNLSQYLLLGTVGIAGLAFLAVNRKQLKQILLDKRLLLAAVFAVIFLLPMLAKRDWQLMYVSTLLCLLIPIFMTYFISWQDAAKYYVVIMTALGIYSVLATYILRILPDRGILSVPVFYNSNEIMFHNFGLAFVSDVFVKDRNFGIFREPGVYQYFIILALVLNNYGVIWQKQSRLWFVNVALAITMVTTFATGGVAALGLLVLVVFFDKKLYQDKRALAVAVLVVVAAVILVIVSIIQKNALYWALWDMIVWKLMMGSESASDRTMSIVLNVQFFLGNPLFGDHIATVLHSIANNTSSTTLMGAMFGLPGLAVHVVSWVAMLWEKQRKFWVNFALVVIMFVAFNTQNMVADVFFWLFPVMALTEKLEQRKKKV